MGARRPLSEETKRKISEKAKNRIHPAWTKERFDKTCVPLNEHEVREAYESGLSQREVATLLGVLPGTIFKFMRRHGIKSRSISESHIGNMNPAWKYDKAGYKCLHKRLCLIKGQPKKCEVCGTTDPNKRYEWASLTGDFANPDDYKRMCCSCHRKSHYESYSLGRKRYLAQKADEESSMHRSNH